MPVGRCVEVSGESVYTIGYGGEARPRRAHVRLDRWECGPSLPRGRVWAHSSPRPLLIPPHMFMVGGRATIHKVRRRTSRTQSADVASCREAKKSSLASFLHTPFGEGFQTPIVRVQFPGRRKRFLGKSHRTCTDTLGQTPMPMTNTWRIGNETKYDPSQLRWNSRRASHKQARGEIGEKAAAAQREREKQAFARAPWPQAFFMPPIACGAEQAQAQAARAAPWCSAPAARPRIAVATRGSSPTPLARCFSQKCSTRPAIFPNPQKEKVLARQQIWTPRRVDLSVDWRRASCLRVDTSVDYRRAFVVLSMRTSRRVRGYAGWRCCALMMRRCVRDASNVSTRL